eukprot:scaffold12924_cov125-Isochrysis_galbana.AAC.12
MPLGTWPQGGSSVAFGAIFSGVRAPCAFSQDPRPPVSALHRPSSTDRRPHPSPQGRRSGHAQQVARLRPQDATPLRPAGLAVRPDIPRGGGAAGPGEQGRRDRGHHGHHRRRRRRHGRCGFHRLVAHLVGTSRGKGAWASYLRISS